MSIPIRQDSCSGECKRGTEAGKNAFMLVSKNQKQNIGNYMIFYTETSIAD